MNYKIFVISTILMSLQMSCESKQFCQTFVANGNKISFIFRRLLKKPLETTSFDLLIDSHYWRLRFTLQSDEPHLEFDDQNHESKESPFFGGNYRMGACLGIYGGGCWPLLFTGSEIVLGKIFSDDSLQEKDLSLYEVSKRIPDHLNISQTQDMAFPSLFNWTDSRMDFVKKVSSNGTNNLIVSRYKFETPSLENQIPMNVSSDEMTVLNEFKTNQEIIGIHSSPDSNFNEGLLLLLSEGKKVFFCWTQHNILSESCKNPKQLIDCSKYEPTIDNTVAPDGIDETITTNETTIEPPAKGHIWWYIMAIVLIILLLIIGFLIYKFYKRTSVAAQNAPDLDKKPEPKPMTKAETKEADQKPVEKTEESSVRSND